MALTDASRRRTDGLRPAGAEVAGLTRMVIDDGEPDPREHDDPGDIEHDPNRICVVVMPAGRGPDVHCRGGSDDETALAALARADARLAG